MDLFGQPADYVKIRKIADKYDNVRIGMNSRLDTMQAAVLQVKLQAFREFELEAVNRVAKRYTAALKEKGIPSMVYYPKAMHDQGAFADTPCVVADLSVTTELCKRVLALPMHPYLEKTEQKCVIEAAKGDWGEVKINNVMKKVVICTKSIKCQVFF